MLRLELLHPSGGPATSTEFADFRELAPGVLRPFRFTHTLYVDGLAEGRRIVWSYSISSATALDVEQADAVAPGVLGDPGQALWAHL